MLDLEIIGQGATTTVYRDGSKAIKLYVNAPQDEAENEAKLQRFAVDAGLPVPKVNCVRRLEANATALDMEYIAGKPLMHPKMSKDERRDAIQTLVELQCMVHKAVATGLPRQADCLAWKIRETEHLDKTDKNRLIAMLDRLDSNADNLCHGDFHPLNILYDGEKHWIIDWVNATAGSPLADACRTYLIFKQHITRSAGIYLKLFCKEAKTRPENVLMWVPIIAAARLDENLDDKSRMWLIEMVK